MTVGMVRTAVGRLDLTTSKGARDAALLVIGLAGGSRRSELVGIDVEHVTETPDGLVIRLPRGKTDRAGRRDLRAGRRRRPVTVAHGLEATQNRFHAPA